MICGTQTRTGVTAAEVPQITALLNAVVPPPTSVTSTLDGTGTFTVVATWPPCAANTTVSAGTAPASGN